ncbi:MAG: S8 family serine peptidase [Flavobacteriaceae bacterium]|nr:S8 family serine peptidase [Flavobacteriaceae bacterium]
MRIFLICSLMLLLFKGYGQEDAWVYFKDKPEAGYYLENPLLMLSQKALDRRSKQGILLDEKDVPISQSYIDNVRITTGIEIKAKSKWLNALHINGSVSAIGSLIDLSFVESVQFADKSLNKSSKRARDQKNKFDVKANYDYGSSFNQINMLGGDYLHEKDFTGKGMTIAVMDAGFPNVDTFTAFQKIRDNGQLLGGYNFVNRNENVFTGYDHGTAVLSVMAGYVDGQLIGTAPEADYYLFITEDSTQETPLEESLWVEAAEKADSLGVDVINTSLGYYTFDDPRYNYTYADMNGNSAFITRGADIAFSRGMILVNAAGNEGTNAWHYIIAPADGFNVLSVGAVDALENVTGFSSYGPSYDGRVKPDVLAKGGGTTILNSSGIVSTGNGTSFASPVICGLVACLWQAYPTKTNAEIVQMIRESADRYHNPTDHEGYGLPDFKIGYEALLAGSDVQEPGIRIYPNPFDEDILVVADKDEGPLHVTVMDALGKKLILKLLKGEDRSVNCRILSPGIYMLNIQSEQGSTSFKIIKR